LTLAGRPRIIERMDTATPGSTPPTPRAEIGVLLVHGIGDHKEGETLISFGEPMIDWLRDWLRGKGDEPLRGKVVVTEARLKATRTEAVSPAYAQVEISLASQPNDTERWLIAEAWWGDTVQAPRSLRLMGWLLTRGPLLVYWHFHLRPGAADDEVNPWRALMAMLALALAGAMQLALLVAMLLWLIPFGPWRRVVAGAVRAMTLTLGDSFVLLEQDFQSAALVRRVQRSLDWLAQRAQRLIVVAHSQGGAIAHQALSRMNSAQIAAFISVGSGLEKLEFLRHVRYRRAGLAAASLLAPLLVIGAATFGLGFFLGPELRWVIGLGVLVLLGAAVAYSVLAVALRNYQRELRQRMAELDLRPALGQAEWHDLHATQDVVPMGDGSLLNGQAFVERHAVRNQRSFLNDHIVYFDNRMGFLPLLWHLMAPHSGLPLLGPADRPRIARAIALHRRRSLVLLLAGLASLAALVPGLIVLRHSLVELGASVLARLDDIGLAALAKPLHLLGRFVVWVAAVSGLDLAALHADQVGDVLLGGLTLCAALLVWWAFFKAAWLAGSEADWRHACRAPERLDAIGWRPWDIAGFVLWLAFGLVPLTVACLLVFAPETLTLAVLGRAVTGVMVTLGITVAAVYAIGSPWLIELLVPGEGDTLVLRVLLPLLTLLIVLPTLALAQWFWPAAWGALVIDALVATTWAGMALSWAVWLLLRGRAAYGRPGVGWLLLWPLLAAVAEALWDAPADPTQRLANYNAASMLMVSVAQAFRFRAEIWAALRAWAGRRPAVPP
jgi:hypothetical protein